MGEDLDEIMEKATAGLQESTELGEVAREFDKSTPSNSNLTQDEFRLTWRAENILKRLSPKSVEIIRGFVDQKRSVNGWNTNQKVQAITGVQQQRGGNSMMDKLFGNKKE